MDTNENCYPPINLKWIETTDKDGVITHAQMVFGSSGIVLVNVDRFPVMKWGIFVSDYRYRIYSKLEFWNHSQGYRHPGFSVAKTEDIYAKAKMLATSILRGPDYVPPTAPESDE